MLEELERGPRRTGAVVQIGGASFREVARPVAKHKAYCRVNLKNSSACSAPSRALAIVIVIGGFFSLTPSSDVLDHSNQPVRSCNDQEGN